MTAAEIVGRGVGLALLGAGLGLVAVGAYAVLLVLAALLVPRRRRPPETVRPRIAALVVAHDEERVVRDSARTLVEQDYGDRGVFCVADRCTDGTATAAREAGATVFERIAAGPSGKAEAVAFGLESIERLGGFDAIAVFDADNAVDTGFLTAVARRLGEGERVVQGSVDAKNPGASWVAASSALGFWALAALAQGPRERLGLSVPLMGTGFALRTGDAKTLLGGAASLTDDLELGARLALAGIRAAYEPTALVADEKPVHLGVALEQRKRWMQGRWAVAGRFLPELVRRACARGVSFPERVRALDVAFQLVLPSLLFTAVALGVVAAAALVAARLVPASGSVLTPDVARGLFAAALVYYAVPAVGIARFRPPFRVWLCYAVQPAYLVWSAPLAVAGWFLRGRKAWAKTPKGQIP